MKFSAVKTKDALCGKCGLALGFEVDFDDDTVYYCHSPETCL